MWSLNVSPNIGRIYVENFFPRVFRLKNRITQYLGKSGPITKINN